MLNVRHFCVQTLPAHSNSNASMSICFSLNESTVSVDPIVLSSITVHFHTFCCYYQYAVDFFISYVYTEAYRSNKHMRKHSQKKHQQPGE